jgi:hypothetical protein
VAATTSLTRSLRRLVTNSSNAAALVEHEFIDIIKAN